MPIADSLNQLVGNFARDLALASNLESANPEDDLAIRAAVVGFSYNSPTEEWDKGHFEFVNARLERDFNEKELLEYGDNAENVRLFFALCLGYLLGLYQQDAIGEAEFNVAEMQISGLILLHLPKLTAHRLTG